MINYSVDNDIVPTKDTYINTGSASGDVAVGNSNKTVTINGCLNVPNGLIQKGGSSSFANSNGDLGLYSLSSSAGIRFVTNNGSFRFFKDIGSSPTPMFAIESSGQVGIGTTNFSCSDCSDYNLFVKKGIRTERVKIDVASENDWADFVFRKDYGLMSIDDL